MASEEWSLISVFPRGCTSKVRSPLLYITKLINWGRYSIGTQTSKLPTGWGPMGEVWKWGTWESSRPGRISLVIPLHTTVMLPAATSRIIASRREMAASSFGEILFLACHYCYCFSIPLEHYLGASKDGNGTPLLFDVLVWYHCCDPCFSSSHGQLVQRQSSTKKWRDDSLLIVTPFLVISFG